MSAAEKWNNFLDKMVEARESWAEYQEERIVKGISLDTLDVPSMRHMSSSLHRAKFDIALPRLVEYWRRYGGIEGIMAYTSTGSKFDGELDEQTKKELKENDGETRQARRIKATTKG